MANNMELSVNEKSNILIVDDSAENLHLLIGLLSDEYKVKAAKNGLKALQIAQSDPKPDLILLDVIMPELDGLEVCRHLKSTPETSSIPIIFITSQSTPQDEVKGFSIGAVDYISKPFYPPVVLSRVKAQIALHEQSKKLEQLVKERTKELESTRLSIIQKLGKAAEFKDNETGNHVIRMAWYSKFLAQKISDDEAWVELLFNAAPMHDIGKIGIPDNVLLKPGKLNEDEWQIMMTHAEVGGEILSGSNSTLLQLAVEVAIYHHEKWNGKGYPKGLSKENIPLSARIVAIADVFDALTSERPYKKAWSVEKAIALIKDESGQHFDPTLVPLFIECLPEILEIKASYAENTDENTDENKQLEKVLSSV